MINCDEIIEKFYNKDSELWNILYIHSSSVAKLALSIIDAHPELNIDRAFVYEGAMLHDIGICKTNAPDIKCFGSADYICHGILGAQMLSNIGLTRHALICERHTGAGLTADYIKQQNLPLPIRDLTPQSIEEQLICYADKFFSKSRKLDEQKTLEQVTKSLQKFGNDSLDRFLTLHQKFSITNIK